MPKGKQPKRGRIGGRGKYYAGGMTGKGKYFPGGRVLRGRGGFFDDIGGLLKSVAGPALGALGGLADSVIPGAGQVTQGIRRLAGLGAYTPVKSNAILAQPVPKVGSSQDKGIKYTHQEFLGDVTGSADWELTQFHVNPGLPESFPWLSGLAGNFQKYRIDGLVFYLRSTSSVAIASSSDLGLGTVLGGYQYNVYDKAPSSKVDFLALSGALSGKPSEDHIYPMECDRSKNVFGNLLVRTVGVADDLQKYDHAIFNLATVGFPGEYYLGELWVSYNITLMAPKVENISNYLTTICATNGTVNARPFVGVATAQISGGGYWCTPPVGDPLAMFNECGWSVDASSDGVQCLSIPAGTAGVFLVTVDSENATGSAPPALPFPWSVAVKDNSGTAVIESRATPGSTSPMVQHMLVNNTNTCGYFAVKIDALPDKPMKLLFGLQAGSGGTVLHYHLDAYRLADKLFAATEGATVSLRQKVARRRKTRSQALVTHDTEEKSVTGARPDEGACADCGSRSTVLAHGSVIHNYSGGIPPVVSVSQPGRR